MNVNGFVSIQRPDGKVFDFGVNYFETAIEGAGTLTREIYTEARGNGWGDIVTGSRIPAREINLSSDSMVTDAGNLRDLVDAFFRYPEDLHKITIKYKNSQKWIKGYIQVYDLPLKYVGDPQEFNLSILCPDPLFKSVDEFGKDIANVVPHWGWPVYSPMAADGDLTDTTALASPYVFAGNVTGVYDFTLSAYLQNNGDFPTAPRIVVTVTAPVENLKFYISDDEYVLLETTINVGDVIEFDFNEETITRNGVNISNLMTRDSTFFDIPQGGVEVFYQADVGETAVHAKVYYNQLYKAI